MLSSARRRRRSTARVRACTGSSIRASCGPGISRRSARIFAPTHQGVLPVSNEFESLPGAVGSPPEHYGNPLGEQRHLAAGDAVVDLSDRAVVSLTGPDRLTWLDSLMSQAV